MFSHRLILAALLVACSAAASARPNGAGFSAHDACGSIQKAASRHQSSLFASDPGCGASLSLDMVEYQIDRRWQMNLDHAGSHTEQHHSERAQLQRLVALLNELLERLDHNHGGGRFDLAHGGHGHHPLGDRDDTCVVQLRCTPQTGDQVAPVPLPASALLLVPALLGLLALPRRRRSATQM